MVTPEGLSLARSMVTPPSGAGVARVTGNGVVWSMPTVIGVWGERLILTK